MDAHGHGGEQATESGGGSAKQNAKQRYDRKNRVVYTLNFNRKTEPELVSWMDRQKNRQGKIKGLILAEIKREENRQGSDEA